MTVFDAIMILNTVAAVLRQISIAHCQINNFYFAILMNIGFTIAYIDQGLWSGLVFSAVHTILTGYGWYRWKYNLNEETDKCQTK